MAIVYVLNNPAFDNYVKIGRTTNLEQRLRWHENYFKRYFSDYFSNADKTSMLLNEITPQYAAEYWDWRKDYWKRKEAEKLRGYNPKRRNAKTLGTGNAKKPQL